MGADWVPGDVELRADIARAAKEVEDGQGFLTRQAAKEAQGSLTAPDTWAFQAKVFRDGPLEGIEAAEAPERAPLDDTLEHYRRLMAKWQDWAEKCKKWNEGGAGIACLPVRPVVDYSGWVDEWDCLPDGD